MGVDGERVDFTDVCEPWVALDLTLLEPVFARERERPSWANERSPWPRVSMGAAGAAGEMGGVFVADPTVGGEEEVFTFGWSEIVVGESVAVRESCLSAPFIILLAACWAAVYTDEKKDESVWSSGS